MSLRKAYAMMVVICFALMLVPFQAVFAADLPKILITEVMPNGKNVPDPNTGKTFNEAFELIEIYNNSKQDIPLKDFSIMYGSAGAEKALEWIEGSADKVLVAGGVMVIWPKQAGNPFTVADFYNHNVAKNPDLKMEQVAVVLGPQMHNTAPKVGSIVMADGTVVCTFAYDGVTSETVDDRAIKYAYPTDGSIQLRKISFGAESFSTPGMLEEAQIPAK